MPKKPAPALTPDQAVDRLETLHATATSALRRALERFVTRRTPPSPAARRKFRYPELRLIWSPQGPMPFTRRHFIAGATGPNSNPPAPMRRRSLSRASSATICWSSFVRWSPSMAR